MSTDLAPYMNAFRKEIRDEITELMGTYGSGMEGRIEAAIKRACDAGMLNSGRRPAITAQTADDGHNHAACKCGGRCTDKSKCADGSCSLEVDGSPSAIPLWRPAGAFNPCYGHCKRMDKCLAPYMEQAYGRTDDFDWFQRWISDPMIVHINKNVGAAPTFNSPALPLGAGERAILSMQDSQTLPFRPGGLKVAPKWSADPGAPAEVTVTLYSGPKASGPQAYTTLPTTWTKIGEEFTLADFECAKDCYILPYPKLLGCIVGPIPADQRAIYIQLVGGTGMGAIELVSLNFTVLKRGTDEWFSNCRTFGWDPETGYGAGCG